MRKIICIILLFGIIHLNAQTEKKYLFRSGLGYKHVHYDMVDANNGGAYGTYFGQIINELALNFNASRKLNSSFYYGLGLLYNSSKQEFNPEADRPQINGSSGFGSMTQYVNTVNTDQTISPYLFIEYFNAVSDRFTIAFDIYTRYDLNTTKSKSILLTNHGLNQPFEYSSEYYKESNLGKLCGGIRPSIRYAVFKNAGLEFTYGRIEYSIKIKDSRTLNQNNKTNTFELGFGPENWLVGFYVKI
jgi:hypothetical protein